MWPFQQSASKRLNRVETQLDQLRNELRARASFDGIDAALLTLTRKSMKGGTNHHYLGRRLSDYEAALQNIKQLGYYVGLEEAKKSGVAERMSAVDHPPDTKLASKLCTQDDCESDWYYFWLKEMCSGFTYHRKLWEFCYIAQNLYAHGALQDGKKGLAFGCGQEPLPSLFAKHGASVTATDLDPALWKDGQGSWAESGQHADSLAKVLNADICPDREKLARISHEFVDMNRIPNEFAGSFDFCWSACALEHLGSLDLGVKFILASLKCLKPGGIAVHTTEYNLDEGETIDNEPTVLYQKKHLLELSSQLTDLGYVVSPFQLDGGGRVLDGLFDLPPWPWDEAKLGWRMHGGYTVGGTTHLKKSFFGFLCTSVGITVAKPA
jgi:SAM-dependent methyltransferase